MNGISYMYNTYNNIKNNNPLYSVNQYLIKPAVFGIAKKLGANEGEITVSNDVLEGIWNASTGDPYGAYINFDKARSDYKTFNKYDHPDYSKQLQTNPKGDIVKIDTLKQPIKAIKDYNKRQKQTKISKESTYGQYTKLLGSERNGFSYQDFQAVHKKGNTPLESAKLAKEHSAGIDKSHDISRIVQERKELELK